MKHDIHVKNGIVIPAHELEITASRSGGAGGQHVNKTNTRITVRWNVIRTQALNDFQKERLLHKLASQLTTDGDLIIHNSTSRSQEQNKKAALANLAHIIKTALHISKKRVPTSIPESVQQARLKQKKHRSKHKQLRSKKISVDE